MQVDGAFMRFPEGSVRVDLPDDVLFRIDDLKSRAAAAQTHVPLGTPARSEPFPAVSALEELPLLLERPDLILNGGTAHPLLVFPQGDLTRRALHMPAEDHGVVGIEDRVFRRTPEKFFGVADEELIKGVFPPDQNDGRLLPLAAHPAPALQGLHDAAGIPHEEAQVEGTDINAEFEGARGNHGQKLA